MHKFVSKINGGYPFKIFLSKKRAQNIIMEFVMLFNS